MQLPTVIQTYFDADRSPDAELLTHGLAPDAIVHDEGATYAGHAEIRAWRLATRAKYANLVAEPVEQTADGNRVTVRCKVSGDFRGSPAMLDFSFTLVGDQIGALEIH